MVLGLTLALPSLTHVEDFFRDPLPTLPPHHYSAPLIPTSLISLDTPLTTAIRLLSCLQYALLPGFLTNLSFYPPVCRVGRIVKILYLAKKNCEE